MVVQPSVLERLLPTCKCTTPLAAPLALQTLQNATADARVLLQLCKPEYGVIDCLRHSAASAGQHTAEIALGALANIQSKVGLGADSDEELHDVIDQRWRQEASDAIRAVVAAKRMQAKWRAHRANVKARYPSP